VRQVSTNHPRKVAQATLTGDLAKTFADVASAVGISEADLVRQSIRAYLGKEYVDYLRLKPGVNDRKKE